VISCLIPARGPPCGIRLDQAQRLQSLLHQPDQPDAVRIGLETGPTSTLLWTELKQLGLPVICIDAPHAKAVLKMQINKSGRNDAIGIARIMQTGWFKAVHVKDIDSHSDDHLLSSWVCRRGIRASSPSAEKATVPRPHLRHAAAPRRQVHILDVKGRTESLHVEEAGILLIDPPTRSLPDRAGCRLPHPLHHREVRSGALQSFGHDQLLTSGHERDADIACLSHLPRPSASGINNDGSLDRTPRLVVWTPLTFSPSRMAIRP